MASLSGHLAWQFRTGRFLDRVEAALGRPFTAPERRAFADDAHGGWWETSMMLLLRPDLVDEAWRTLPPARYPLARRLSRTYALRNGGRGYVGHPALADPAFARATTEVLLEETMTIVDGLLDGRIGPTDRRSPFFAVPVFRTDFWRVAIAAGGLAAAGALGWLAGGRRAGRPR
jgi:creatinine amidohydrolase/Fe(II)-dependent formamide hydrolase-like protein